MNIGFLVTQPQLWHGSHLVMVLKSVGIDVHIIAAPDFENAPRGRWWSQRQNVKRLRNNGAAVARVVSIAGHIRQPRRVLKGIDLLFVDQPGIQLGPSWNVGSMPVSLAYIPYGIKVSPLSDWNFSPPIVRVSKAVFAETRWHFEKFLAANPSATNLVLAGPPKLDTFRCPELSSKDSAARVGRAILWAPHWSIMDSLLGYGTFDVTCNVMLGLAREFTDVTWILRAHQRLATQIASTGAFEEGFYDKFIQKWNSLPNTEQDTSLDSTRALAQCDGVITDSGSYIGEATLSGTPLMLLESPNSQGYNDFGQELLRHQSRTLARSERLPELSKDLREFVENVGASHGETGRQFGELREAYLPHACASSQIAAYLKGDVVDSKRCLLEVRL